MKKTRWKSEPTTSSRSPSALRFSPTAWAKLLYLRDAGETEIGGFGLSAADDLLLVQDVELVRQTCTWAHVAFDDDSVADYFEHQVAAGRQPEEFARIWIHTHPGKSAQPSGTDELTFSRVFGRSNWAIMAILARGGETYARLRYNTGPGADVLLPVEVEYRCSFEGSNTEAWRTAYIENVRVESPKPLTSPSLIAHTDLTRRDPCDNDHGWYEDWDTFSDFNATNKEPELGFIRNF